MMTSAFPFLILFSGGVSSGERYRAKFGERRSLWLGHESVDATHGYVEADLTMTENALGKLTPAGSVPGPFKPAVKLLACLEAL